MKYCTVCGNLIEDDSKFCDNCGNKFAETNQNLTHSVQVEPSLQRGNEEVIDVEPENKPKKCTMAFSVISIVFMCISLFVFALGGITVLTLETLFFWLVFIPMPIIALVFAVIGLIKGIKTKNVASIILSAISLYLLVSFISSEIINIISNQIVYDPGFIE